MNAPKIKNYFKDYIYLFYSCIFLFLALFAAFFFKERIHGADASSFLFNAINNAFFYTERGRIIIYLSQWLPLLAVWFKLSMKTVLIAYAIGNVVFFYLLFSISYLKYNRKSAGLGFLLIQTLGITQSYFAWSYGEIYYGVGLVLFIYYLLSKKSLLSSYEYISVIGLMLLLVFGHPLVYPVFLFSLSILLFNHPIKSRLFSVCAIFIVLLISKFLFQPSYDSQLTGEVQSRFFNLNISFSSFMAMVKMNWIIFISLLTMLIYNYSRPLVNLTGLLTIGVITFVISLFLPIEAATQQYYLSYSGVVVLLFILNYEESKTQWRHLTLFLIGLSLFICGKQQIYAHAEEFILHRKNIESMVEYGKEIKQGTLVIKAQNLYKNEALTWVSSDIYFEALLLSSLVNYPMEVHVFERLMEQREYSINGETPSDGPDSPMKKDKQFDFSDENKEFALAFLQEHQTSNLNSLYFNCGHPATGYFTNSSESNEEEYLFKHLSISSVNYTPKSLEVVLSNSGQTPIYTANLNNLAYRIVINDNLQKDTLIAPVLLDIYSEMTEYIEINTPYYEGAHSLELLHQGNSIVINHF